MGIRFARVAEFSGMRPLRAFFPELSTSLAKAHAIQILVILITLCFVVPSRASAANSDAAFEAANKLYEEGRFAEAATAYETLLRSGGVSAPLYFNLGNAYFKAGQLGRAIVAYRNARLLNPRDPDITANLQFARNQRQGPSVSISTFERWLGKFSLNEWTTVTAVAFWTWLLLLALAELRPALKKPLHGTILFLTASTVLLGILLIAVWRVERLNQVIVVTVPQAAVRHGPLEESQVAFTVNDGAELRLLDRKDGWYQVTTGDNRLGWLKKESVILE
jgi:tetratricopeptide (TPR) repeat protein